MARDRQRGRQRRGRSSADDGVAARPAVPGQGDAEPVDPSELDGQRLDAARDSGIEDVLDERGPDGTTPAPDPLKHSSPYVDEAKLGGAGVSGGYAGTEHQTDALGYSAESASQEGPADPGQPEVAGSRSGRAVTFLRHSGQELKRVRWPDRRQTGQGTAVTLGFVVLAGGFLGLMDAIWQPIIEAIL